LKKVLLAAAALLAFSSLALAISPSQNTTVILPKKSAPVTPPSNPQIIPPDRNFAWNPGMMSKGGIPNRTTVCATLSPSGGNDTAAIQAKLDSCPSGQVVMLNPGTFIVNNFLIMTSGITLRGSGKGVTILRKTNGGHARLPIAQTGATGIFVPENPGAVATFTGSISGTTMTIATTPAGTNGVNVGDFITGAGVAANTVVTGFGTATGGTGTYVVSPSQAVASRTLTSTYSIDVQPILIIGPAHFPGPDNTTARNLTADGAQGATSVTVASGTGIAAGQFVLLDELSGASWQPTGVNFGCTGSKANSTFTASLSGSTLTVTAIGAIPGSQYTNVIWPGDYLSVGTGPPQIVSQISGTTGQVGVYTVTPGGQSVGSTSMTSGGPCPPLNWAGDRISWPFHWPEQVFVDDVGGSNINGPFNEVTLDTPYPESWFNRTDRPTNEIKEVASVAGNVITFTSPISITYRTSHTAQLTRYTGASAHVTNAGVENLSMYGGGDGNLNFLDCGYCWAKNIEITEWYGPGIGLTGSFRVEVRDSYIHRGAWPDPGGAGYAISLQFGTSELLVENNILLDSNKDMVMRSSGTGSVIAYNYADDTWIADDSNYTWQEVGLNASHFTGPHHVLFEGNYGQNFDSDYTHGNSIYLTVFRNVLSGQRRSFISDAGNPRAVGLAWGSWYDTFIGNVLGRSGQMSGWHLTDPIMNCDANGGNCVGGVNGPGVRPDVWVLGYDAVNSRYQEQADPKTLSTVIRDGNYDFLTNAQHWYNTPATFAMPSSLYLSARPAFFGNNSWPWSDPVIGAIYTLPAKARYDAGAP
jgi:hypothetical protein